MEVDEVRAPIWGQDEHRNAWSYERPGDLPGAGRQRDLAAWGVQLGLRPQVRGAKQGVQLGLAEGLAPGVRQGLGWFRVCLAVERI